MGKCLGTETFLFLMFSENELKSYEEIFIQIGITNQQEQKQVLDFNFDYVNTMKGNNNITSRGEKIINTYKNASYEPINTNGNFCIKVTDDSMAPVYLKNDKIYKN